MVELLPLVGIVLLFWLFIIRPTQRRQRELGRMQSSLSLGDDVMLTSGVLGTVRELTDEHVGVEIADGVVIRVVRGAIGSTVGPTAETGQEHDQQDPANGAIERPEES